MALHPQPTADGRHGGTPVLADAGPAGPRHVTDRAAGPRVLRPSRRTSRLLAVAVTVAVGVGGVGVAGAVAAPKHLGAPKHLFAPKHLSAAPKHLSGVAASAAIAEPAAATGARPGTAGSGTVIPDLRSGIGPQWWRHRGLLHGRMTVQTRSGLREVTLQRGVVTAVDATAGTMTVRSPDGFTAVWALTGTTTVRVRNRPATVGDIRGGAQIGVAGTGAESAPTAGLVVLPGRPPRARPSQHPAGAPSTSTSGSADAGVTV